MIDWEHRASELTNALIEERVRVTKLEAVAEAARAWRNTDENGDWRDCRDDLDRMIEALDALEEP